MTATIFTQQEDHKLDFHPNRAVQHIDAAANAGFAPLAADVHRLHSQANPVTSATALLNRLRQTDTQLQRRHSEDVPAAHAPLTATNTATPASCTANSTPQVMHQQTAFCTSDPPHRPVRAQTTAPFQCHPPHAYQGTASPSAAETEAAAGTQRSPDHKPMGMYEAVQRWLRQTGQDVSPHQGSAGLEAPDRWPSASDDTLDETYHGHSHHDGASEGQHLQRSTERHALSPSTSGELAAPLKLSTLAYHQSSRWHADSAAFILCHQKLLPSVYPQCTCTVDVTECSPGTTGCLC